MPYDYQVLYLVGCFIYWPNTFSDGCHSTLTEKIHECKEKIVNDSVPANSNWNGNDISLEVFLKKLQSIGITIDMNKLRNCEVNKMQVCDYILSVTLVKTN